MGYTDCNAYSGFRIIVHSSVCFAVRSIIIIILVQDAAYRLQPH